MTSDRYTIRQVSYPSGDIDVNALLFEPADVAEGAPAIVHHPSHKSPAKHYEWYLGKFAEAGYVGLGIEQRGYGSGPAGRNDRGGPLQQGDIANGITFLSGLPSVDAGRIAVSGHSNGAALALIVSSRGRARESLPEPRAQDRLDQGAAGSPGVEAGLLRAHGEGNDRRGRRRKQTRSPFRERSPIHYAGDIKVPVLFIVGAQDWVNPSYHCTDMADALRQRRQPGTCRWRSSTRWNTSSASATSSATGSTRSPDPPSAGSTATSRKDDAAPPTDRPTTHPTPGRNDST